MYPSIGDNSILIIKNTSKKEIRIGDVVIIDGMVHRVIRITNEGFNTKGDNNKVEDIFLRNFSNVQGKVVGVLW